MKKKLGIAVLSLFLVACGEPMVDISSDSSLQRSIHKVRESLPQEKQRLFDDAINTIILNQVSIKTLHIT